MQEPHQLDTQTVLDMHNVQIDSGLSSAEVDERRVRYGLNVITHETHMSGWSILLNQVRSLLTALLFSAALVSFIFQDLAEGIAILVVIALNTGIGFYTERKAIRSVEALQKLGATQTVVKRDGLNQAVQAQDIVPGDIVILTAGDIVTADCRLLETVRLRCDESLLTGESTSVAKQTARLSGKTPLYARDNMVFKGTAVIGGSAVGIVVATAMGTELGQISRLANSAEPSTTPLNRRLRRLSQQLIGATLALVTLISVAGIATAREPLLMVKTGIALAVAAIPESLPIVATLALARGMWQLARRNALIKHLAAVETLGSVTAIFTDKTGTLTENRMAVRELLLPQGNVQIEDNQMLANETSKADIQRAMRVCALCNNADLGDTDAHSDPMELALLQAAQLADVLPSIESRIDEQPFDPETRMMTTLHQLEGEVLAAVKGAPEVILQQAEQIATTEGAIPLSAAAKTEWLEKTSQLAAGGLRVLAMAEKHAPDVSGISDAKTVFLGLVGLHDPPRPDARPAIEAAQQAGIKVIMVTGDNAATATSIAQSTGLIKNQPSLSLQGSEIKPVDQLSKAEIDNLLRADVFARVSPRQKLDLITLYQNAGQIVAMTGDGVNDAPALQKADIGISMGIRGTEVAKQASDMILKDDGFASITIAIKQGRTIFSNIRQFVIYLLSCNISEILLVTLGILSGLPLPLLPLQILFLNLVTDTFPALALGAGNSDENTLKRPPRAPNTPIVSHRQWLTVTVYGINITLAVLAAFVWALQQPDKPSAYPVSVAFLALAFAQMWHVFNMRGAGTPVFNNRVARNPYIWVALLICIGLIMLTILSPLLSQALHLIKPDASAWLVIMIASVLPLLVGQTLKQANIM